MDTEIPALIEQQRMLQHELMELRKAGRLLLERRRLLNNIDPERRDAAASQLREELCDLIRQEARLVDEWCALTRQRHVAAR